jgi:hypothetical protein
VASEQFIVAGLPDVVGPLLSLLATDPDAEVVSVAGPPTAPERLVVVMDPERAVAFAQALGGRVLIEPDDFVTPSSPPGSPPVPPP